MKIRHSFVANSSSSSFIVIQPGVKDSYTCDTYIIGDAGEYEFGWQNERYDDFPSKINFAYMQYEYVKDSHPEWKEMLEEVIKEHTGAYKVVYNLTVNWCDKNKKSGYIDHQSASCEGENTEMFASKEALSAFLFCGGSYIQGGNDNE